MSRFGVAWRVLRGQPVAYRLRLQAPLQLAPQPPVTMIGCVYTDLAWVNRSTILDVRRDA